MIRTAELEKIIKLALLTPYVKGERPVSILVSARVESGKTELMKKANLGIDRGIAYLSDMTAWGIQNKYLDKLMLGEIKTIVVPDLITPLSRSSETVETLVSFLNGLIEEGICELQTYARSIRLELPVRCNLITSIAKEYLEDRRHRWNRIGFLSRVMPVSYEYGASSVYAIMQSIASRAYREESIFNDLVFPTESVEIELPAPIAQRVATYAPQVIDAGRHAQALYGFRLQKQLQTLCMANALLEGRNTVTGADFDTIVVLGDFMNFNYRQI